MTAYATRAPLQLIENPHMMSEASRGHGRRTSARIADREDAPLTNGISNENEHVKKSARGKQGKNIVNGNGFKAGGKRTIAYDEEDDGFTFTRTRAKKARAAPTSSLTTEEEKPEERAEPVPVKRSRQKSVGSPPGPSAAPADSVENEGRIGKRRSARHSGEHENADPPVLQVKKKRKERSPGEVKQDQAPERYPKNHQQREQEPQHSRSHSYETTFDATKIALPFADTPVIRRNKEMRKTNNARRSSLGLRGRRASSLIDTGKSNALPHDEVESSEFYKHIESEGLSEPRRMKQLLTWCGTRALGEKPSFSSEDSGARLAAREIQSQLLKDFSTKSEMSDWFGRNESSPPPSLPRANPKNLSNQAKIQDLEKQIARLKTERETWESLLGPPPDKIPMLPPLSPTPANPSTIDDGLLSDPTQSIALQTIQSLASDYQPSLTAATSSRLQTINQNLEFEVDKFASNVHALGAYKDAAERVADDVLAMGAEALERRDGEGRARANGQAGEPGTRDVLRALSRVIDR